MGALSSWRRVTYRREERFIGDYRGSGVAGAMAPWVHWRPRAAGEALGRIVAVAEVASSTSRESSPGSRDRAAPLSFERPVTAFAVDPVPCRRGDHRRRTGDVIGGRGRSRTRATVATAEHGRAGLDYSRRVDLT